MNLRNKTFLAGVVWVCAFTSPLALAEKKVWSSNLESLVTRCFKADQISVHCEDGFIDDNLKPTLKDIEISAKDRNGDVFEYSYGRGLPPEMCDTHAPKIKELLRKSKQACISGEMEFTLEKNKTYAQWVSFETEHGEIDRNR